MTDQPNSLIKDTIRICKKIFKQTYHHLSNIVLNILVIHKRRYMLDSFLVLALAFLFILGSCLGVIIYKIYATPDIDELDHYNLYEIPSIAYDRYNRPFKTFETHARIITTYENIPKTAINTLLIAEDRDFFHHHGLNPLGILRASLMNFLAGKVTQGGSTLTQQLAKLLFTNRERSLTRKLKELIYSLQIEKNYTKEEILEKYLNKVYYSNGIYSIAAACDFYFGIPLKEINYAQAAFLISIPPNPTFYNPLVHPMNVKSRQEVVMNDLIHAGYISQQDAEEETESMWESIQSKLMDGTYFNHRKRSLDLAPYFSEYIRRILYQKYGEDLYTKGYSIYTTLDIDLQKAAEQSVRNHVLEARKAYQTEARIYYKNIRNTLSGSNPGHPVTSEFLGIALGMPNLQFSQGMMATKTQQKILEKKTLQSMSLVLSLFGMQGIRQMVDSAIRTFSQTRINMPELEGALISTENKTGRILAMVGGSGFSTRNQINRVYQTQRQPGSTFKPFLYLAALNTGIFTAATTLKDNPIIFQMPDGSIWAPGNSAKNYESETTLRNALRKSINIISIKLLQAMGISQGINFVSNFLSLPKSRFRFDSSLALGTSELSPMELNKGYSIIANGGQDITLHPIVMVKNRYNQVLESPEVEMLNEPGDQLVDPRYDYILITMMEDVFRRGTATRTAQNMNFSTQNIAGKTGTVSNMSDAWFSGFNTKIATTVWIGFDKRATLGVNAFAAVLAEPIWIDYMKIALSKYPSTEFSQPSGIVTAMVHQDNGLLMPNNCTQSSQAILEYFTQETLPTQYSPYCDSKLDVDIKQNIGSIDAKDIFASS